MAITHATPSTVGTPAAGHIPTAGAWDADHTGTNDHGHTATADGGLIAPITAARTATADGLTTGIIAAAWKAIYLDADSDVAKVAAAA